MNVSFPRLTMLAVLSCCHVSLLATAQESRDSSPMGVENPHAELATSGQRVLESAIHKLEMCRTIESKMRVRTDMLGQPLVGSGTYAQLQSSGGLLLRLELAIQAGQQVTSIKQISDGRNLWEHWRIGESERVNHIDLKRVARALKNNPAPLSMSSSNLASGGLPRLTSQLAANFDFDTQPARTGTLGGVEVVALVGVWKAESLAAAAPDAVVDDKIVMERLPAQLPHQVELLLGKSDLFPYRVTYQKWDGKEQPTLVPVVTTEFFEVSIDGIVDATQFHYEQPAHVQVADQTDRYLESMR